MEDLLYIPYGLFAAFFFLQNGEYLVAMGTNRKLEASTVCYWFKTVTSNPLAEQLTSLKEAFEKRTSIELGTL